MRYKVLAAVGLALLIVPLALVGLVQLVGKPAYEALSYEGEVQISPSATVRLVADKAEYALGEVILLRVVLRNTGDESLVLGVFPTIEYAISPVGSSSPSIVRGFSSSISGPITLGPEELLEADRWSWTQKLIADDDTIVPAEPGLYLIKLSLLGLPGTAPLERISLEIQVFIRG